MGYPNPNLKDFMGNEYNIRFTAQSKGPTDDSPTSPQDKADSSSLEDAKRTTSDLPLHSTLPNEVRD